MPVFRDQILKPYSYYGTGGKANYVFAPTSVAELAEMMKEIAAKKLDYFVLGGGTNSLVLDDPWPGAVIVFSHMKKFEIGRDGLVKVQAGVENSDLVRACQEKGLEGVAWMYRLPGQMGGTVRMNARCYGGEISQVVTKVVAVTGNGEIKTYTDAKVFRGYKDTVFMTNGEIIAEVELNLKAGDKNKILEKMKLCEDDRTGKGQFVFPTCGCVFKNDYGVGVPSGMLLDASGGKTLRSAHVSINPHHANFVYNQGADANEILDMTFKMRQAVYQNFGVWMDYEMEILGKLPANLKAKLAESRSKAWKTDKIAELKKKFNPKN